MAVVDRGKRRRRRLRRGGGAILVVGAIIGLIVLLSNNPPKPKKAAAPKATTTTTITPTTTTIAPVAIAPVCPPAAGSKTRVVAFTKAPPDCIPQSGVYDATVLTDVGTFVIRLDAASSYASVNNFVFLARYHFFDGIVFQRVIPGFVVQGGDPTGTGSGGPGYKFTGNTPPASCSKSANCYPTGSVAMANSTSSPVSNESQFFIVLPGGDSQLAPDYSLFGAVTQGLSVVEKIGADGTSAGTPKVLHHMVRVTITEVSA